MWWHECAASQAILIGCPVREISGVASSARIVSAFNVAKVV